MAGEILLYPVDRAPHDSLRVRHQQQLRREDEARAARRQRIVTWGLGAITAGLVLGFGGTFISERQQQIERDSRELAGLVREQGFTDAEAYKPTENNEAYIIVWMHDCELGNSDIRIDNVSAMLRRTQDGPELVQLSRRAGEVLIGGQWKDNVQHWLTPAQFCEQEAKK